jgi:hypothetical protein
VQQVDDVVLGPLEAVELLLTPLRRAIAGLEILAPQDRVHVLEHGAAECHGDSNTQKLVGLRLDVPVEGARPANRWPFRSPSELIVELPA